MPKQKRKVFVTILLFFLAVLLINGTSSTQTYLNESEQWQGNLTPVYFSSTAVGDVNNDGNLDIIIMGDCGLSCNSAKVYINNGTTFIENLTWGQNLTGVQYGSLSLGDIDNDGDLDLASSGCSVIEGGWYLSTCNEENYQTFIYMNNGTSFVESLQWESNLTKSWKGSLVLGDINNDGKLDLALNGQSSISKISKIYINNGTSLIENPTWGNNLTAVHEGGLAFGDINNDGKLDLALCGDSGLSEEISKIYTNNGTTLIEDLTWEQNLLGVDICSLAFGDYDSDGDLDLSLIGHTTADNHRIYRNNYTSFIEIQRNIDDLIGIFMGMLAFGDYDTDGYLDLIATGYEGYTTLYLYNLSSTNFTTYPQDPESDIPNLKGGTVVWSNLDNDTDLDLIETGYGGGDGGYPQSWVYLSNRSLTKNNTLPTPPSTFTSTYSNNVLTLVWNNGSDAETNSTGLYYNIMVGNSTTNNTIVSGVYGGSSNPTAGYFGNMMQRKNITLNVQLTASETYNWYVQTIDTGLAKSEWSTVQSFTTSADVTKPIVTLNPSSPDNGVHRTNPVFVFNASVIDANIANVTLYADWTGSMIVNETNLSAITANYSFTKDLTGLSDGLYSWYIYTCDTSSNCQSSGTRTFYLDRAYPLVYSESPANGNTWTSSSIVTFNYNVSDTDIANCSLIINGAVDQTDTTISESTSQSFTKTLSNADYTWNVNCTDYVNYKNSSVIRSLIVSYTAPVSPGGGGGGGGSSQKTNATAVSPEIKVFDVDFSTATTGVIEAKQGDVKTFSFQGEIKHSITILTLTINSMTLLITSDPITAQINVGETKQIDINSDGINDFEIKLDSIILGKAKFSLTKLSGADAVGKEELGEEALFDVKVSMQDKSKEVLPGEEVTAKIEVFNVNNIGQVDVVVDYFIIDKENNTIAEGSDTLAVEAVTSFVRSLKVPYNTKSGIYYFGVDIKYNGLSTSGRAEFRVRVLKIEIREIIIGGAIIFIILTIIIVYLIIKKREEKMEKRIQKEIKQLKGKNKENRRFYGRSKNR